MDADPQLRELQLVFIDEAKQLLAEAEENLLELERRGFDPALVDKAFRLAHNFKGSSRSVGFNVLGTLAHRYEDVLSAVKSRKRQLSPRLISSLLRCNDVLRREIECLQNNAGHKPAIDAELASLNAALEGPDDVEVGSSEKVTSHAPLTDAGFAIFDDEPVSPSSPRVKAQAVIGIASQSIDHKVAGTQGAADETLKVPARRLDALLNIIGELVVNQSILDDCRSRAETNSEIAAQALEYMSKLVSDLQSLSLSLRLVPIKPLFQKLRRTARDVAESMKKDIDFVDEGDYCELDKTVIDSIADPLNHMIRNAIDHGVDTAEERASAGKPKLARVKLSAVAQDDQVKIIISDDGRGLNKEKILAKAIANGMIKANAALSDAQIYSLIFAPGFSTKDQVTDVSGRGVGMEVVQRAVDALKGTISIESRVGKGTTFEISLPLSLSIVGGMVVQANGQRFIIPVSQLLETIELNKYSMETVAGSGKTLNLRGEVLPVFHLTDVLTRRRSKSAPQPGRESPVNRPALVTTYRGRKVTFEVDRIISQQKVVMKKLGREFDGLPGIVAGAILSNGEPGLVLSLDKLAAGADL